MTSPLDEAAAFFDLFARSDWASCHVRTGALEIFVARSPGQPNPMIGGDRAAEPPMARTMLGAPHLGTVASLAAVGEAIAVGGTYAVLELLDERIELVAEEAGTVVERLAAIGALAEFDQPLIALC